MIMDGSARRTPTRAAAHGAALSSRFGLAATALALAATVVVAIVAPV